jgi:serine protease inhibitor
VLELENKNCRDYGTFVCAGRAAEERERVRSHDDLKLRWSGADFNKNIQQNRPRFAGFRQGAVAVPPGHGKCRTTRREPFPPFQLVLNGHSVIQVVMGKKLGFVVLLCFAGLTVLTASPAGQEKLTMANTGFAFDLLKQIAGEQPGINIFISPFSVSTVLQMVANGAAGDTKTEMQRVLKTTGLPPEALNAAGKDLNQSLNSQTNVILNLANAIWYKNEFHLKPEFVSVNKEFFKAELGGVDFTKPESAQTINDWAETSTHGKIKQVVRWPFDPLTRVILANAIYFKGKWERPFDKHATKDRAFYVLPGGTPKQVPTMWQHGRFNYQQGDGFQAVRLPYAGGHLQMYLFLPNTNSSPAKLLADLNAGTWQNKIPPKFQDLEGTLALPRFKLYYDTTLNKPLKALGMRQAFTVDADFSAMADKPLFVSEVKQKSFVEVNEEGTEAAAVTTATLGCAALPRPNNLFEMIVDRPFLFVIADDQTKSVLFMGVIYDPAGQGN